MNPYDPDDISTEPGGPTGNIETLLRQRLNQLADYAPTTVVYPGEVRVSVTPPPQPRRRWLRIGVPVFALIAGGGITAVATTGQNDGGAATPMEAMEHMVAAIEREDVLGVLDTMLPAEVTALRQSIEGVKSEATRTGLLDERLSLSGLEGLDMQTENLQMVTEELGEGLAIVRVTGGALNTSIDPAAFPFGGPLVTKVGELLAPTTARADLSGGELFAATVERDGRWYVSLTYTAAEYARRNTDANVPPMPSTQPEGFDTPEAAADAFYRRAMAFDLNGLLATAAPGEGEALVRYASLWVPGASDAIASAQADGLTLQIDNLQLDTAGEGDTRLVTPVTYRISGTTPPTWFDYSDYSEDGPPFDPTLPTAIFAENGTYVIAAGDPIPPTVEGLTPIQNWDGDGNVLLTEFDGTIIQPVVETAPESPASPLAPLDFAIERTADGCIDATGAVVDRMREGGFFGSRDGSAAQPNCTTGPFSQGLFGILLGGGLTGELPRVSVVEHDGRWYVSPIGTIIEQGTSILRTVGDADLGLDSPLAVYIYDTNREMLEQMLVGQPVGQLSPDCVAIVESDAAGNVTGVIADPAVSTVSDCQSSVWNSPGGWSSTVGSVDQTAATVYTEPLSADETVAAVEVPATTLAGG